MLNALSFDYLKSISANPWNIVNVIQLLLSENLIIGHIKSDLRLSMFLDNKISDLKKDWAVDKNNLTSEK
jgi:hypothetical protein